MQRKFFMMIILQVWRHPVVLEKKYPQALLPLIILSMPLGLFGVAIITGMAMDLNTLALSFSLWLVPIVQVLIIIQRRIECPQSGMRLSDVRGSNEVNVVTRRNDFNCGSENEDDEHFENFS